MKLLLFSSWRKWHACRAGVAKTFIRKVLNCVFCLAKSVKWLTWCDGIGCGVRFLVDGKSGAIKIKSLRHFGVLCHRCFIFCEKQKLKWISCWYAMGRSKWMVIFSFSPSVGCFSRYNFQWKTWFYRAFGMGSHTVSAITVCHCSFSFFVHITVCAVVIFDDEFFFRFVFAAAAAAAAVAVAVLTLQPLL